MSTPAIVPNAAGEGSLGTTPLPWGSVNATAIQRNGVDVADTNQLGAKLAAPNSASDSRIAVFNGGPGAVKDGGQLISDVLDRANHTGTQLLATISDAGTAASHDATDFQPARAELGYVGVLASSIASANTTSIGAVPGQAVLITGTTGISSFGTAANNGIRRLVIFAGSLTLTYNATSLILPTGASLTTAAGDVAEFINTSGSNWTCVSYIRANGQPLAGAASSYTDGDAIAAVSGAIQSTGNVTGSLAGSALTLAAKLSTSLSTGQGQINTQGDGLFVILGTTANSAAAGNDGRFPSTAQIGAMAGTNGTVNGSNPFVTNSDPRLPPTPFAAGDLYYSDGTQVTKLAAGATGALLQQGTGPTGPVWSLVPSAAGASGDGGKLVLWASGGKLNGIWNGSVIGSAFGGLGANVSGSTGIVLLTAGVASFLATIATQMGGLGMDLSGSTGIPLLTAGVASVLATSGTGNAVRANSPTITTPAIVGDASGGNAASGNIGEYQAQALSSTGTLTTNANGIISTTTPGTVSLTNNITANVLSLALTAGDWDVEGNINVTTLTSATISQRLGGLSTTSATLPTDGTEVYDDAHVTTGSETNSTTAGRQRISFAAPGTVYLTAKCVFSAGTMAAFGSISARRIR